MITACHANRYGRKQQIELGFFVEECRSKKGTGAPVNTDACQDWYAALITHEASHAASRTDDHIYFAWGGEGLNEAMVKWDENKSIKLECTKDEIFGPMSTPSRFFFENVERAGQPNGLAPKELCNINLLDEEFTSSWEQVRYGKANKHETETDTPRNKLVDGKKLTLLAMCCGARDAGGNPDTDFRNFRNFEIKAATTVYQDEKQSGKTFSNLKHFEFGAERLVDNADSYGAFLFPEVYFVNLDTPGKRYVDDQEREGLRDAFRNWFMSLP